jgi:hypothetical protein
VRAGDAAAVVVVVSPYPLRSLSAISLPSWAAASAAESKVLTLVWPAVPTRPQRRVTSAPSWSISQNFADAPSTNSKLRMWQTFGRGR